MTRLFSLHTSSVALCSKTLLSLCHWHQAMDPVPLVHPCTTQHNARQGLVFKQAQHRLCCAFDALLLMLLRGCAFDAVLSMLCFPCCAFTAVVSRDLNTSWIYPMHLNLSTLHSSSPPTHSVHALPPLQSTSAVSCPRAQPPTYLVHALLPPLCKFSLLTLFAATSLPNPCLPLPPPAFPKCSLMIACTATTWL